MRFVTFFAILALTCCSAWAEPSPKTKDQSPTPNDYPRPELLLEPTALAKPETGTSFIVLDARTQKAFGASRVPGARWVDAAAWAKAFKDGTDVEGWSARIGNLGVNASSRVVVYDGSSFNDAARIWWILRFWGVEDVRLLNGNWKTWKSMGLPVETGTPQQAVPVEFTAKPRSKRLATKGLLLASLKDKSLQIVDARSEGEFCGLEKMRNKRAGAIPGAKHLEWIDLIDKETQRFKTPDQLRKLFAEAGIDLDRPTATHCQSGGRASVMAFGMELMGASNVANYYASWGEWGNSDDTPIVVTSPKNEK
jgi:thiosulfate/3-mercaptopyruvate sulfurtransferase